MYKRMAGFFSDRVIWLVLCVYSLGAMLLVPNFSSVNNVTNILLQSADMIIASCGVMFVVLNGGIDFSCTSIMALASVFGAKIMTQNGGFLAGSPAAIPAAILAMLAIGMAVGVVNAIAVVGFKMPSFIVTLATTGIGSGIAVWYTTSDTIGFLPEAFNFLGHGRVLYVPIPIWAAAAVVYFLHFLLSQTLFGRQVYAIGTNPRTAIISGLPVKRVIFTLFIISGLCASLAGILETARLQAGVPGMAANSFIDILAGVIIGGTSTFGGSGRVMGTVSGVLLIIIMNNTMNLLNVNWVIISIVKGAIILVAAFIDASKTGET